MSELNLKYGEYEKNIPAPASVADAIKAFDRNAAKKSIAAKINGEEFDLNRELTATDEVLSVEAILPDTRDGLEVIRHSTAHLLAAAVLDLFPGTKLGVGPALMEDPRYGFYYDVIAPETLTVDDLQKIEKRMREMAKRNLKYRRDVVDKNRILEIFKERDEPLKCELISEKIEGDSATIYYIDDSPFIDFCLGPHVPHTGKIKAFKLLAISGAYWKGDAEREQMQRIYGTAFATQEELDAWTKQREEAEKRDLWKISGHEENYSDSMFSPTHIEGDDDTEFRLKPMNCPFHIGIYKSNQRSYRDLPQRYSELGTVYRAELSGTLHGMMRVRGFTVDDAHLFVRPDQVHTEVADCLDFALKVFDTYGFEKDKVNFELSVRGGAENKGYLGADEDWENAESSLANALKEFGISYERIEGEAAFYGPKIDIKIEDAIGRIWQLGTIQLDFNLPERFNLEYTGEDGGKHRPVMIHRALFGSIERFFGILVEQYAGAFPFWLAPVQITVLPITDRINDYAEEVAKELSQAGFRVESNLKSDKIGSKIREAQLQKIPFMLVLGDVEKENNEIAVREKTQGDIGTMKLADFIKIAEQLKSTRAVSFEKTADE